MPAIRVIVFARQDHPSSRIARPTVGWPWLLACLMACLAGQVGATAAGPATTIRVTVDRGSDQGQCFGTLFEATTADGGLVIGAGFANHYNTSLRGDRHAVQLFVRPTGASRPLVASELPRPNSLCGTYLVARDEKLYSTAGGIARWEPGERRWLPDTEVGGTGETMRVGDGILELGESTARYQGRVILPKPAVGLYQKFFYALGRLCFYHVNRPEGQYRPFTSEADGFSRLYACPWTPAEKAVDLSKAETLLLPVVGETTFAWGQIDRRIVTGSNLGGFYEWRDGTWSLLRAPEIGVSFQLYSSLAFGDRLLMGQYPTGRLFSLDGQELHDMAGWPPVPPGVSGSSREAQTTCVYGGELFVGVWPWGEVWRYHPDLEQWSFVRRLFDHPEPSTAVVHPYDVENKGHPVGNQWGQRVTSLLTIGDSLFASTSAKSPCEWEPEKNPFLAPDKWRSYGAVHQLRMPGHVQAATAWTDGPTTIEFQIRATEVRVLQDGREIARTTVSGDVGRQLLGRGRLAKVTWKSGLYGPFGGRSLDGAVEE